MPRHNGNKKRRKFLSVTVTGLLEEDVARKVSPLKKKGWRVVKSGGKKGKYYTELQRKA